MVKHNHPLENVFGMEAGSVEPSSYDIIQSPESEILPAADSAPDEDDRVIDKKLDDVYSAAISAYENQTAYAEIVDPKFAARNAEVAANFLTIALAAVNSRAKVKSDRKRSGSVAAGTKNTTNNILVANREDILKMINVDSDKKDES